MRYLILASMLTMLLVASGCITSQTGSLQSAPVSYNEGVSSSDDTDYIQLTVHVLFREVPSKGAIGSFAASLGRFVNDLNVVSAVTSIGTQPERMISRLEDGKRAHVSIPVRVPLPDNRDTTIDIDTGEIKEATGKALENSDLDDAADSVYVSNIGIKIKSTMADGDNDGED